MDDSKKARQEMAGNMPTGENRLSERQFVVTRKAAETDAYSEAAQKWFEAMKRATA
jgi:hypothetical protein